MAHPFIDKEALAMEQTSRVLHPLFREKIMSAQQAAQWIQDGMTLGVSGFTGAGYPKALPTAIAEKAKAEHAAGKPFAVRIITGASTAPSVTAYWRKQMRSAFVVHSSLTPFCAKALTQAILITRICTCRI